MYNSRFVCTYITFPIFFSCCILFFTQKQKKNSRDVDLNFKIKLAEKSLFVFHIKYFLTLMSFFCFIYARRKRKFSRKMTWILIYFNPMFCFCFFKKKIIGEGGMRISSHILNQITSKQLKFNEKIKLPFQTLWITYK